MNNTTLKGFAGLVCILFFKVSFAQLSFSSINAVDPTCHSNGSVTINASGGSTPYTYKIISGPSSITYPIVQLAPSNNFNALVTGLYTIRVVDAALDSQVTVCLLLTTL